MERAQAGRSRSGTTLVEVLVSLLVGLIALAAIVMIVLSVRRMEQAGDLSGALQEAALAMAIVQKDLTQAVQKPSPGVNSAVLTSPKGFQLIRGVLMPDGSIRGIQVQYRKVFTSKRNYRLERKAGKDLTHLPGLYRSAEFVTLNGAGGPFVRVTLHLAVHDTKVGPGGPKGSEEAVLSSLVRIQGPEMVGSRSFPFKFMDFLRWLGFPFSLF